MKTRIKDLREDNDKTQQQVAYSYYELNRRNIPLELLAKLADYYHTSVDYLLYRTDDMTPYPKNNKPNCKETLVV